MSDNFDPYYKWLGIPPEEQPPHHYRLLGLRPFESDPDVIANAVDQRMTHLRTFQGGKNAAHSQKILNEISTAKLCLLSAPQKAEYDRLLRGRLAKSAATGPANMPGPPAAATTTPTMIPMAPLGYPAPAAGTPLSGMSPQAWRPQPMPQMVQPGMVRQGPLNQPAAGQASPGAPADFGEIVSDSSRRRSSRSRRHANSWALPAIVIAFLLAALVGVVIVFKNGDTNELLAKLELSPGNQKSKANEAPDEPRHGSSTKHHAAAAKDQQSEPSESGPANHSPAAGAVQGLLKRLSAGVAAGYTEDTATVGGPEGMDFRDLPKTKTGALLVGFEFGLSPLEDSDTLAICSVQGIFSGGGRTHKPLFRKHGGEPQSITSILADEGYAVGGLELAPGDRVTGVRVHFCAITKDGLSRDTSYDSDWIGPAGDEPAVKLGDGRRPVVGIAGASSTLVNRLGLILATSGSESPTPEKPRAKKSLSDGPTAEPTTKTAMTPQAMLATGTMPPSGAMPTTTDSARRVLANLPGGSDQPLAPVPDPEAIRAAKLKIRDSFKDSESGASSSKPMNKKWELARRLYEASKTEDDQVVRYALLDEARKLTVQTGDLKAVLMTIDDLASRFQIDEVPLTIESLTEASKVTTANSEKATTGADKREVAQKALRLIAKAVEHEQFADADKLVELARKLATGDSLLRQQITWRSDRLAEQRKAYEDAQPELETLKNDPSDAAANLVAGRYRCLFQEDWKAGLPLLAKGSDDTLKRLAEQELNPPGEPDAQVKLGDEWLSAAGSNKPSAPYFKMRARQWYETAWPRLTGVVSKQSTQMKLEEMLGGHGLKAEFFSGVDKFDNPIKSRVDPQIDFKWNQSPMDDLPPQFTVRWTGLLVPPGKGGQFTIVLERDTDAGARLWLDSKLLIDEGSGPRGEYKSYKLAAKSPRRLKLVYFSAGKGKNAHISLRWSQKEEFPEQPIPAESLFQEHSDAEKVYSQLPVPKPGNNAALIITSSEPVPTIPLPTRTP